MKFAQELGSHITPEWRKQYIQYEKLKSLLEQYMMERPDSEFADDNLLERGDVKFREKWFNFLEEELKKITTFYSEKTIESTRNFNKLKEQLKISEDPHQRNDQDIYIGERKNKKALKMALSEFYLSLVIIQDYQKYNLMGFKKINKKFDKNLVCNQGGNWFDGKVKKSDLSKSDEIDSLILTVELLFTNELEKGNRKAAMARLKVPPFQSRTTDWQTLLVGMAGGGCIILFCIIAASGVAMTNSRIVPTNQTEIQQALNGYRFLYRSDWSIVTRLFRGPMLCILMIFFLGLNVRGWAAAGVNHKLIFELDPRHHSSHLDLLEIAAWLSTVWAAGIVTFIFADYIHIPAFYCPLAVMITFAVFLFNPFRIFKYQARRWLIKIVLRILLAPIPLVVFADFWLADQFNSLAPALKDFHYFVCFYSSNHTTLDNGWDLAVDKEVCNESSRWLPYLLVTIPAYWRWSQCLRRYRDTRAKFPHLVNAGKYSSSMITNLASFLLHFLKEESLFYVWLSCKLISTVYSIFWDLKMDFGFFAVNSGVNKYLREELVYSSRSIYYTIIIEDIILRLVWIVGLVLKEFSTIPSEAVSCVLQFLEVFRRFVWNFIRLENEHLNNCGQFRIVRDISIAPIANDQEEIITMMDHEDGVQQVRRRRKEMKKK